MLSPFARSNESFTTPATPVSVVVCMVGRDVQLHARLTRESGRTEGAVVRPLSRVGPDVVPEMRSCHEPGQAHRAPVGLHTFVGPHMRSIMRDLAEPGATLLTLADHLPCVDQFVPRQVTTLCERFPADVTHVRPVSGMC